LTAVPLWIAFLFARRRPSRAFTYGFGRVEDLAGAFIVLAIFASAVAVAYVSIDRLINPRDVHFLWAVAAAGAVGFVGNEAVALFRIRVGREINSAALIADGHHARADGLTSLAVLGGAAAIGAGYPIADPIVGLVIAALITKIVWDSSKAVFTRMLDGVDGDIVEEIEHLAAHVPGVLGVSHVRARWVGHRLEAEVHLTARGSPTLTEAHDLTVTVGHELSHALPFLDNTVVHIDPLERSGITQHRVSAHEHDGLPMHGR
jgi:cation diffusion facilitator family transporter